MIKIKEFAHSHFLHRHCSVQLFIEIKRKPLEEANQENKYHSAKQSTWQNKESARFFVLLLLFYSRNDIFKLS